VIFSGSDANKCQFVNVKHYLVQPRFAVVKPIGKRSEFRYCNFSGVHIFALLNSIDVGTGDRGGSAPHFFSKRGPDPLTFALVIALPTM